MALAPYILCCPTRVRLGSFNNSNVTVVYEKDLSNGKVAYIEAQYGMDGDILKSKNMWADVSNKVVDARQKDAPNLTSKNVILAEDVAKIIKDAEIAIEKDEKNKHEVLHSSEAYLSENVNPKQTKSVKGQVPEDTFVRFSISKSTKQTIDSWLNKREDLTEADKEAFRTYMAKYEGNKANEQLAVAKWFVRGNIRIEEDDQLIREGLTLAERMHIDAGTYDTPSAIINDFFSRNESQENEELLSPDEFSDVLTDKTEYQNGITVYDVEDSKEGQNHCKEFLQNKKERYQPASYGDNRLPTPYVRNVL